MSSAQVAGLAIGSLGLSLGELSVLRPDELEAALRRRSDEREAESRERWEQARTVAAVTIQPHVRGSVSPRDVIRLPWDEDESRRTGTKKRPQLTRAEAYERYRRLAGKG